MEFTGKIIQVFEPVGGTSSKTGNPWSKQQFIVEEEQGQYPKKIVFEVFGEDKYKAMPLQVGNVVTVYFDIDAHEFNNRWRNDVRAWRVVLAQQPHPEPQTVLPPPPVDTIPPTPEEGGLPF